MISPYYQKDFFSFFIVLFSRFFEWLTGNLTYPQIASDELQILVLILISLSSCLVGTFLVLRKSLMLANSLSHTILIGIVISFYLFSPKEGGKFPFDMKTLFFASLISSLLTTFCTEFLSKSFKIPKDASIGLTFTTFFAIGILFLTILTRNAHIGTEVIMGNVDALQNQDLFFVFYLFVFNLFFFLLFFKEYVITSFDSSYATSLGIFSSFFSYFLMVQVSFTIISGFRAVGVLMILSFITTPVLTARLFAERVKSVILFSMLIASFLSIIGVALARHFYSVWGAALSTGGLVVTLLTFTYLISLAFISLKEKKEKWNWKNLKDQT